MDTVFGGDGRNSFGVPNLTGPIPFLAYQLCSDGYFPARADDDYDNGAMCDVGSIVLEAQSFQPAGWVAADGRSLQVAQAPMLFAVLGTTFGGDGTTTFNVPTVPAPKGLKYWVCANGDPWKPGARTSNTCTISSVTLFGTTNLPGNFMPADGRLLPINQFQVLYSLYSNNFGGDGIQTFALPKVPPPVPGTAYGVCSQGFYPQRS
jgi:microcystin-dependent protein